MGIRHHAEKLFQRLEPVGGEDVRQVMDAALALDIKEFDLFLLAWRHWNTSAPDERQLERAFGQYMLHQRVPSWVRQFARDVLRLKGNGTLNPSKFGVSLVRKPPAAPPPHARLTVAGVAALACLFVALLISTGSAGAPAGRIGCAAPGQAAGGMRYTEIVAQMFTGKTDPYECARRRGRKNVNGRGF